jgi:hypothetical protein
MPAPNGCVVKSLTEYVDKLEQLLAGSKARHNLAVPCQNWYRGISNSKYALQPSLFRVKKPTELEYLKLEAKMMQDFERHAILRGTAEPNGEDNRSRILKLFHMQHYGVPTRLLDWSTNPFIAMYFALSTGTPEDPNPCVWVLDPWAWNETILADASWEKRGPAHIADANVEAYHPREDYAEKEHRQMAMSPAAVLGVYNTERMRAQRGVFMIFGKSQVPMETVYDQKQVAVDALYRIEVERAAAPDVFNQLTALGYTDSVAYPDFMGVALEIRRSYGFPT